MTIDWTRPVRLKGSKRTVEILTKTGRMPWPIVGYIEGCQLPTVWYADGSYRVDSGHDGDDLENIPETHTGYINVYEHCCSNIHLTRANADKLVSIQDKRVACIKVTYERGQFDE